MILHATVKKIWNPGYCYRWHYFCIDIMTVAKQSACGQWCQIPFIVMGKNFEKKYYFIKRPDCCITLLQSWQSLSFWAECFIYLLISLYVLQVVLTLETKGFDCHEKHSEIFLKKSKHVSIINQCNSRYMNWILKSLCICWHHNNYFDILIKLQKEALLFF